MYHSLSMLLANLVVRLGIGKWVSVRYRKSDNSSAIQGREGNILIAGTTLHVHSSLNVISIEYH